ncbi:MAG: ATP phosphoribosyltransferase [Candidatus Melainabacteria bacterium]|nr:ATP phosphoribosyltransferase [Candidatus Melainabacteria bacterium]
MTDMDSPTLKLLLPKGRIQEKVMVLLAAVGHRYTVSNRSYKPVCSDAEIDAKILKAQNIPALVALGRHDCGFTGHDWVQEQQADVVELLDLGYDPVRIVAAVPEAFLQAPQGFPFTDRPLVVASEYRGLTERYLAKKGYQAVFVQTYGATEALPPDDADMIVDNTATGSTLRLNRLAIVDTLLESTTRFVANRQSLQNPWKRRKLEELCMLMESSIRASKKVLLEMNVPKEALEAVVASLPSMKSPTVSPLFGEEGFAIKTAVDKADVSRLIPSLMAAGARDILEYHLEKIVT